jgi:Flp pilus assembly protein TadD
MGRLPYFTLLIPALFVGCQGSSTGVPVVQTAKPASAAMDLATRYSVARVREQEGKLSSAATILKELCAADPQNAVYTHRYGIVLSRLGDFEQGLKWLAKADALSPENSKILNDLGYACLMTGRAEQAVQVFATSLELDPQNTRALNNLALAHGYMGQYDKAHELFLKTMTEAEAMSNLGYVATQAGNKDFAINCYSRALDLDPELTEAKEGLVQLAELEQRLDERQAIAKASRKAEATNAPASGIQQASHEEQKSKQTTTSK